MNINQLAAGDLLHAPPIVAPAQPAAPPPRSATLRRASWFCFYLVFYTIAIHAFWLAEGFWNSFAMHAVCKSYLDENGNSGWWIEFLAGFSCAGLYYIFVEMMNLTCLLMFNYELDWSFVGLCCDLIYHADSIRHPNSPTHPPRSLFFIGLGGGPRHCAFCRLTASPFRYLQILAFRTFFLLDQYYHFFVGFSAGRGLYRNSKTGMLDDFLLPEREWIFFSGIIVGVITLHRLSFSLISRIWQEFVYYVTQP